MKRFLVFAYEYYYPGGGWNDFRGDFSELNQAAEKATQLVVDQFDEAEVIDSDSSKTVFQVTQKYDPELRRYAVVKPEYILE